MFKNILFLYVFTIYANLINLILSIVNTNIYLNGINREIQDSKKKFDAIKLIWNIKVYETVIAKDLLSPKFRNYFTHLIFSYRNDTGIKV